MNLEGKKAIVLGGTSGIGLAATQQLQEAGATVIAGSRSQANRERAAAATGDGVSLRIVDVLDRDALAALFDEHAGFHILVNAATGGERASGPFLQMDMDGFQGSFRKLWGYANSVRLGAPKMAADGAIVLVSGFPAKKANPGAAALSTVGNAVEGFARAIAPELAPRRINVVSPGVIDTPMFAAEGEAREQLLAGATRKHAHQARRHRRRSGIGHPLHVAQRLHDRRLHRHRRRCHAAVKPLRRELSFSIRHWATGRPVARRYPTRQMD